MKLRQFLQSFNLFTLEELSKAEKLGETVSIKKGAYFIREGEICKKLAFVQRGIFRSFYYSSRHEETTYCFTFPNLLLTAYSSFITGRPSPENIQAISDANVIMISKNDVDALVNNNVHWLAFSKIMAEEQYLLMEERIFQLQTEKAEKRYNELIKRQPEYIQKIPLQYLASYLGITQRHLSRLRQQIKY